MNVNNIKIGQTKDIIKLSKNISLKKMDFLIKNSYSNKNLIFTFYRDGEVSLSLVFCLDPNNKRSILIYDFSSINKEYLILYGSFLLEYAISEISKKYNLNKVEFYFSEQNISYFEQVKKILNQNSFQLFQAKYKLVLKANINVEMKNFTFKSVEMVGKKKFLFALEKISSLSLDREDIKYHKKYGGKKASLKYFNTLKENNHLDDFWELAYYKESLVGLIISQIENKNTGIISYIGIIPEMRGNRYIDKLIFHSIKKLSYRNRIIAETDFSNNPMLNAFSRNGFVIYDKTYLYEKVLYKK